MAEDLVVNTGPLITFDRIGCLDLVGRLPYRFLCPSQVRSELDRGEVKGHSRIAPAWLGVQELARPLSPVILAGLDPGEAAVIQLAEELGVPVVAIDEWKGRRVALASGLRVTGSLGLLGRAKALGLISAMRPYIERAEAVGIRYHREIVRAVLQAAGED